MGEGKKESARMANSNILPPFCMARGSYLRTYLHRTKHLTDVSQHLKLELFCHPYTSSPIRVSVNFEPLLLNPLVLSAGNLSIRNCYGCNDFFFGKCLRSRFAAGNERGLSTKTMSLYDLTSPSNLGSICKKKPKKMEQSPT